MASNTFFFIPDISGFTTFVKSVAVEHSQHIIAELLELIIDTDELELSVAEVEGDAVFFYKQNELPPAEKIVEQVQKTYVRFHEHLKQYETRRICQCGACSSASKLSLKFIVHEGEASFIKVKGSEKPFGEDVIRVHRLLKNSIAKKEYLLYTNNLLDHTKVNRYDKEWAMSEEGEDEHEGLGFIAYKSIDLSFLKELVTTPPPPKFQPLNNDPVLVSISIKSDKSKVFEIITNLDEREKWNPDVPEFKYNKGEVNRVGTTHICVLSNRTIEFETVTQDFGKDKFVYGEKSIQVPLLKEATSYFIVDGNEEETTVRVEIHYKALPLLGWLAKLLLIGQFKKQMKKNLLLIKELAEAA